MNLTCISTGSTPGNCYLLQDDNGHYLCLDCGKSVSEIELKKSCNFNVIDIDAVIYTHCHQDHFGHQEYFFKSGIMMYGCFGLGSRVNIIPEKAIKFLPGNWKVVPWLVPHTGNDNEDVDCYAYYIESPSGHRMVYLTDFMYSRLTFLNLKIQTLLVACNHDNNVEEGDNEAKYRHILSGHSSLNTVKEIIRKNQTSSLRNIILCHLSESNATPVKMLNEIHGIVNPNVRVSIARRGRKYNLDERRWYPLTQ